MHLAKGYLTELYPYKIVIADKGCQGLAKPGLQTPKLKIFKILPLHYRNRRKRFGLRANLIAGLVNAMG